MKLYHKTEVHLLVFRNFILSTIFNFLLNENRTFYVLSKYPKSDKISKYLLALFIF